MPMDAPCCENGMKSISQQVANKLIPFLATQPKTPELIALVKGLIEIHPAFTKLVDIFIDA